MSRNSKLTFGNILLGLLLLGTVIVIGLIVLVYFQLTGSTQRNPAQQTAVESVAKQPVEIMSPDGKPVRSNAVGEEQAQKPADTAQQQKEADAAAAALNNQTANAPPINTRALTAGAHVPKKPRPKKPRPPKETADGGERATHGGSRYNNSAKGEIPLEPTNRAPRENAQRERPLVPRNSERRAQKADQDGGERTLTPVKPKRQGKQSEAIDALF